MILESIAIAVGLWRITTHSSATVLRAILEHPFLFEVVVFIILMLIHGGSSDGAMAATIATAALGFMHQVYRTYFMPTGLAG